MNKILITGPNGFLAKNFVDFLGKNNDFFFLGKDHSAITKIVDFNPDYIYHFAAEIYDESKMIESNFLLTYNLLENTKQIPYKKFVYLGTSSEYGQKNKPMSEVDLLEPRNLYESTKGAGTLLCQSFAKMHNKPIIIIRPFSVYGMHEKPHKLIPTLARSFINKLSIKIYDGSHDFIFVEDFMKATSLIVKESDNGDIINVGFGKQYTNQEVYEIFCKIFGYSIEVEFCENKLKPYDSNMWVSNNDKLKHKYKYEPKIDLEEGIKKYLTQEYHLEIN